MSSSSNNALTNPVLIKGASAFALSLATDKFVFGNDNLSQSTMFAGAVTAGIVGGQLIAEKAITTGMLPDSAGLYEGKLVSQRLLELAVGVGAGYAVNAFVLKNDYNRNDWMKKVGAIIVIDVLSEYSKDYVLGSSLGYLVQ